MQPGVGRRREEECRASEVRMGSGVSQECIRCLGAHRLRDPTALTSKFVAFAGIRRLLGEPANSRGEERRAQVPDEVHADIEASAGLYWRSCFPGEQGAWHRPSGRGGPLPRALQMLRPSVWEVDEPSFADSILLTIDVVVDSIARFDEPDLHSRLQLGRRKVFVPNNLWPPCKFEQVSDQSALGEVTS